MKSTLARRWLFSLIHAFASVVLIGGVTLSQAQTTRQLLTLISDSSTPVCPNTTVPHTFGDRLLSDGSRIPFSIPPGHVFVITSFDWVIEGSSQAKNTVWTAVTVIGPKKSTNALFSGAMADSIGRAAGN